jgi:hypothetical protein
MFTLAENTRKTSYLGQVALAGETIKRVHI